MSQLILPPSAVKTNMEKAVVAPTPAGERCGNCRYGDAVNDKQVECHGLPPTPVMMGFNQDALGRPQPQFMVFYPRIDVETPRCALWALRAAEAETLTPIERVAEGLAKVAANG